MANTISLDEVNKIARLAKLSISESEAKIYQSQLSAVIDHFKILDKVNLDNVAITSQVTGLENVVRNVDEEGDRTLSGELAIDQAKNKINGYIVVPAMLENRADGE